MYVQINTSVLLKTKDDIVLAFTHLIIQPRFELNFQATP